MGQKFRPAEMLSQADRDALIATAQHLTGEGKGILAADESTGTVGKRLGKEGLENTEVKEPYGSFACFNAARASSRFPAAVPCRKLEETTESCS